MKCLAAIEKIDSLLTLPTNVNAHSPFIICMIANVTIAHLSACRFIYEGKKLTGGRDKIRLTMGILKRLSEHWALGKRTYHEIGIIAREVLCLTTDKIHAPAPAIPEIEEPQLDLGSLNMLPGPDLDFCALFDYSVPGIAEDTPQLIL